MNQDRGSMLLAVISVTFFFLLILVSTIWTLAAWLFHRPAMMLALACCGCGEFRCSAAASTLIYHVSFCMEVVK